MAENFPELIEAGLNRSQRKFCKIKENKNIRLLAPAGSGKTFSLLWRCKCIHDMRLQAGKDAPCFLIITFTRAAKYELESRIQKDEGFRGLSVTVRTLNSWGWEQMKSRSGKELITSKFSRKGLVNHDLLSICKDYENIYKLIKTVKGQSANASIIIDLIDRIKGLGFTHLMKKGQFKAHIRYLKEIGLLPLWGELTNTLLRLEKVNLTDKKSCDDAVWEFFAFWKKSVTQLYDNNRFTLEDQKYWPRILLEQRIAEGKYAQTNKPFTHIIIDEFQDINPLDLTLIKAISTYHGKGKPVTTMIAGDDDQAIFGWRGTTPKYILNPEKYFDQTFDTCVLDMNYRSPKKIVEASSNLIKHNTEREDKEMKSAAKGQAFIKIVSRKRMFSGIEAAVKLTHQLLDEKGCKNVALIGRKQSALFSYQVIFSEEGTEYNVDADLDIFEGEAMKSLQKIVQIVYRAKDDDSDNPVEDILTICDKVDRYQIQNKEKNALRNYLDDQDVETFREALEALKNYPDSIKNQSSVFLYKAVDSLIQAESVEDFMQQILNDFRGFDRDYTKADDDTHYKNPQFVRLKEISRRYKDDFRKFYRDIDRARRSSERSRKRDSDNNSGGYEKNQNIKIHLMTATRSKGKEYDAVIILDANEGEWPSQLATDLQEERRLFYVAMTRARKYLYFITSTEQEVTRYLSEARLI